MKDVYGIMPDGDQRQMERALAAIGIGQMIVDESRFQALVSGAFLPVADESAHDWQILTDVTTID